MGAGEDAGDYYVMFISSRVVSLVMSHAGVLTLYADWRKTSHSVGGFGKSPLSLVCTVVPRILAKTVAAFLYRSNGFIWCDVNVGLR